MESKQNRPINTLKAHLAINVRNVEQSIEFYRKMLGIEPSKVRRGYAKFDVQTPPLNLTLNQVPFTDSGALSHLGIQVASTDDVLAQREKWQEAGLITRDEMQTNCCYARQDKTWVHDPDGNQWEVFVVLEDNLAESPACCGIEANEPESGVKEGSVAGSVCAAPTASNSAHAQGTCGCATSQPAEAVATSCCSSIVAPVSLSR